MSGVCAYIYNTVMPKSYTIITVKFACPIITNIYKCYNIKEINQNAKDMSKETATSWVVIFQTMYYIVALPPTN